MRNSPAYRQPEVCDELIERCYGARFQDAGRMLHQATLAVLVAEGLTTNRRLPPVQVTDQRARAWAAFGNSLRVGGDLNAADQALTVAAFHLRDSSGGVLLQAEVLAKLSSLRYDQRRFDESFSLAAELARIWRKRRDTRELCRALVKQAIAAGEAGSPQEALTILDEAEDLVDSDEDPQLFLLVRHNKVHFLIAAGQLDVVQELHSTIAPLYETDTDPLLRLKGRWLTGQILSATGEVEEAAELLSSVRNAFLERNNEYEAALVALGLADACAKLGRRHETRALAREAFRVLRERRVGRDALASLILLESASGG